MHKSVHHGFADHDPGDQGQIFSGNLPFGNEELLGNVLDDAVDQARDEGDQALTEFQGLEPVVRVRYPFQAVHGDVIHPSHGEITTQGKACAEKDEPGQRTAGVFPRVHGVKRIEKVFVVEIDARLAQLAVTADQFGIQIVELRAFDGGLVERFSVSRSEKLLQLFMGEALVQGADTTVGALGKTPRCDVDRFVVSRSLFDLGQDKSLALHYLGGELDFDGVIEAATSLGGQIRLDRIGIL